MHFPVMLAQTFRDASLTPLLFGALIDYGNYSDVAYRHGIGAIGSKINIGPELARKIIRRNQMRYNGRRNGKVNAI